MIELKPCPFCGGKAVVMANKGVKVICTKCWCQTYTGFDGDPEECERFSSLDDVIKKWNRRQEPPRGFDPLYDRR